MDHTSALIHAYIDAYNDHDLARVLRLLTPTAVLNDCSGHGTKAFWGRKLIAKRLRHRFSTNDHLTLESITFGDPNDAGIVGVSALRTLPASGTVSIAFKIVTSIDGSHLQGITSLTC